MIESAPLLEATQVKARFGASIVLDDVSLVVHPGEVVGVVGPNGSGKTTLLNVISGFVPLAAGEIRWSAASRTPRTPQGVARLGVGRTFQQPRPVETLDALDNVAIAVPKVTGGAARERAAALLATVGIRDEVLKRPAWRLSYGERRLVDLARAMATAERLLMLDEPTAGVGSDIWSHVSSVVRELLQRDIAVVVTDHNLEFMHSLCNRAVFLHHGKLLAEGPIVELVHEPIVVEAYVGTRRMEEAQASAELRGAKADGEPFLQVKSVSAGYQGPAVIRNVDLDADRGRILAIVGPNGAGKTTLLNTISGVLPLRSGDVRVGGTTVRGVKPPSRVAKGISHVADGRRVFRGLTVYENLAVGYVGPRNRMPAAIERVCDVFPVLQIKLRNSAASLSGGEQQMLVIARALMRDPVMLLLDEPTMGLAPAIIDTLLEAIDKISASGVGVIITDQDAKRLSSIADDSLVLVAGSVAMKIPRAKFRSSIDKIERAYLGSLQ